MLREILVDVSELEAPLPLKYSTQSASALDTGCYIKVVHRMRPCRLFDFLSKMNIWWDYFQIAEDEHLVFMINNTDVEMIEMLKRKLIDEYGRSFS